jgi:hypothetical protein
MIDPFSPELGKSPGAIIDRRLQSTKPTNDIAGQALDHAGIEIGSRANDGADAFLLDVSLELLPKSCLEKVVVIGLPRTRGMSKSVCEILADLILHEVDVTVELFDRTRQRFFGDSGKIDR